MAACRAALGDLANGVGGAAGNGLVGRTFARLVGVLPPLMNYATGVALFQVFFVLAGVMYYLASRTLLRDIQRVRDTLQARAHDHR